MNCAVVYEIDFRATGIPIEDVDCDLLSLNPDGFVRNCTVDEKIRIMQKKTETCPSHCWVKPSGRLYLKTVRHEH